MNKVKRRLQYVTVGGTGGAEHIRCHLSDVKQRAKCLPLPAVAVRVE
jgi:hypothetical protein